MKSVEPAAKIALVEPQIPQNTGNIGRLVAANHMQLDLVGPLGFDLCDRKLKRAGLDYWPFLNVQQHDCSASYLAETKPEQLYLFTTKTDRPYWDANFETGAVLVFGSEPKGLDRSILQRYEDRCYTIPMPNPNIRSLNLANAVSIVLYEFQRQLASKKKLCNFQKQATI